MRDIVTTHPISFFYPSLSLLKRLKLLSVKQLISHSALITLNIAVIERLSRWYHLLSYPPFSYYLLKLPGPELRPIIPSEYSGRAILSAKTVKIRANSTARQRVLHRRLKASSGKYIQHIEYSESSARGYAIIEKISCPYMPWKLSICGLKWLCGFRMFSARDHGRLLQSSTAVESINLLVIYLYALSSEFSPYHSVSPGRVLRCYLFYSFKQFRVIPGAFMIKRYPWNTESPAENCYGDIELCMHLVNKHFYLLSAQMFF